MSAATRRLAGLAALAAVLAAIAVAVAAANPHVTGTWPVVAGAASIVVAFAVGIEVLRRFPERRLGWLLVAVGVAYFVRSLAAADSAVVYSLARAFGQFGEVLLLWVMLAFPTGRLGTPGPRSIVIAGAASIVLLWWPVVLLSDEIPAAGPLVPCGSACPENAVRVADSAQAADVFEAAFRACGAALLIVVAVVLARRLGRATPIMRRMLAPVLTASVARTLAVAAFLVLGAVAWVRGALVLTYWAVLLSIVVGLLRGRAYDAAALARLVQGLRSRPSAERLKAVMAGALGDPGLDIAYWLPEAATYATADGVPVRDPFPPPRAALTRIGGADGRPVAALVHDPALLDHPELLDAVGASTAIALETNQLEAEVAAARGGLISAVDSERRRIERDLHDGAQQRLIALRMKLSVTARVLDRDTARARALLDELGGDVDAALDEVRALAHGTAPPVLAERGLPDALTAAVRTAPIPVGVDAAGIERYPAAVEAAVYFCCLEGVQNAAKHAGAGASVRIALREEGAALRFTVTDDGPGFDAARVTPGAGLANIEARVAELGGAVTVRSVAGAGTELTGSVPAGNGPGG